MLLTSASIAASIGCGGADRVEYRARAPFGSDPAGPGSALGRIVTTNNGDDTLSLVDPGAMTAIRVPVGFIPVELEGPHHVSADPLGRFLYVNLTEAVARSGSGPHGSHGAGTLPGYVLQISTAGTTLARSVQVDPNPGDNTVSRDGQTLYVTHYDLLKWADAVRANDLRSGDSNLAIVATATLEIVRRLPLCPAAHGVRLSQDERALYTTCGPDEIAVVDLSAAAPRVARVPILPGGRGGGRELGGCERCPYALGVAPDDTVWVSSLGRDGGGSGAGAVDVYDPAQGGFDPARTIPICGRALFAAFSHRPKEGAPFRVYVPEQGRCGDWIRVFEPQGRGRAPRMLEPIALSTEHCVNAHMISISADDATAYLICEGDHVHPGSLVAVDLERSTVNGRVALGVFPDGMALVPEKDRP